MKQKTHSGSKKRVKVRKSGKVCVQKSCKNHLLSNKSKRQKKSNMSGYEISGTKMKAIRKLMPGKVRLQGGVRKAEKMKEEPTKEVKRAAKKAPVKKAAVESAKEKEAPKEEAKA